MSATSMYDPGPGLGFARVEPVVRIARDTIGDHVVSTIELQPGDQRAGELYETLIFGRHGGRCSAESFRERTATEELARESHARAVESARSCHGGKAAS